MQMNARGRCSRLKLHGAGGVERVEAKSEEGDECCTGGHPPCLLTVLSGNCEVNVGSPIRNATQSQGHAGTWQPRRLDPEVYMETQPRHGLFVEQQHLIYRAKESISECCMSSLYTSRQQNSATNLQRKFTQRQLHWLGPHERDRVQHTRAATDGRLA